MPRPGGKEMKDNKELLAEQITKVKTTETIVFQTKSKFVYVNLSNNHANKLFTKTLQAHMHDTTSSEVHLTTDYAFNLYIEKRKAIPKLCVIFKTQKELANLLADNFDLVL